MLSFGTTHSNTLQFVLSMNDKKQRAKQLLQDEQFVEAKALILEMIKDSNGNYKLFEKLGDISIELSQYKDALKYYKQSMKRNPSNPSIYIKIGNLLHEYLNNHQSAQEMYQKGINIDPCNELCWFNYGKLMFKENNVLQAEECYFKCKTPRACVKYHYALLLLSKTQNTNKQNQQKALDLLREATKLKPDNAKYHHQYALCLKDKGLINEANNAFKSAINQKYHDVLCLYDYSVFLSKYYKDYQGALEYLQIALKSSEHEQHPCIQTEYDNLCQYLRDQQTSNTKSKSKIKLIIYVLDEVIAYYNVNKIINGDINKLKNMRRTDVVHDIFGGEDRLHRLHAHFHRVLCSQEDMQIAILSVCHSSIIRLTLKTVGLLRYFANWNIIGTESPPNVLNDVMYLTKRYGVELSTEVLFVDNALQNIEALSNHCITYHVYSNTLLNALTMDHMKEIEEIFGVYVCDKYDIQSPGNKLSLSIKQINISIYQTIKKEIGGIPNRGKPVDSLPVIQHIEENWNDYEYQEYFLYFARMFKLIRSYKQKTHFWSNMHILPKLLDMVNDCEITRRYAQCLSYFHHYQEAEHNFKITLQRSDHVYHKLDFAFFLQKRERNVEAKKYFDDIITNHINGMKEHDAALRVYYGYARTLDILQQSLKAEKYYKLAVEYANNGDYDWNNYMAHYMYGIFLYQQKRYKESKYQFEIALNENENYANSHYEISRTLYKLGMLKEYEYHLKRALEIDPYFVVAKNDLNQLYKKKNTQNNEENILSNNKYVNNHAFRVEFDRFWFDGIGIITAHFNRYYDKFLDENINDIRCVLFNENIEWKIQNKIGVVSLKDLKIIMNAVQYLRNQHNRFVICLNEAKLKEYYPLFAHNAIYTMDILQCNIQCKKDIFQLISSYNEYNLNNNNVTNQFDANDNTLIELLCQFIKKITQY